MFLAFPATAIRLASLDLYLFMKYEKLTANYGVITIAVI